MNKSLFFVALFGAIPALAQDGLNRDSVPPAQVIYTSADELPVYPGGVEALNRFLEKNFAYPLECWGKGSKAIQLIIRKDGVPCGIQKEGMPPALYKELKRVVDIMPLWFPAMKDGRAVDVLYYMPREVKLYDPVAGLPYQMVPVWNEVKKYIDENKDYNKGIDEAEMDNLIAKAQDILRLRSSNVELSSAVARMLAGRQQCGEALAVADTCARIYHRFGINDKKFSRDDYPKGNKWIDAFVMAFEEAHREGSYIHAYDGRKEVHIAVTRALMADASGNDSLAEAAYALASDIIDERILLGDIKKANGMYWSNGEYKRLMDEKIYLSLSPRARGVNLDYTERREIFETWTYGEAMREIDHLVRQGKISNARIKQINSQLKEMSPYDVGYNGGKDSLKLYGLKALVIYLSQGMDAQRQYMENAGSQSKELKKYFTRMDKNMQKHSSELSDRDAVLRSLACFAPINDEGDSKEEKKQRAKEFYKYRDAVKEVYPLEWLWK